MSKLNKALAMSLATLTLAGSSSPIFAGRTSIARRTSSADGTGFIAPPNTPYKKSDVTKPIKEVETKIKIKNRANNRQVGEAIDKIYNKIYECVELAKKNDDKYVGILSEIYNLVEENYSNFINIKDETILSGSERSKLNKINMFMIENAAEHIWLVSLYLNSVENKSQDFYGINFDSNILKDKKGYLMRASKLVKEPLVHYVPDGLCESKEYKKLMDIIERLRQEEQKRLTEQEKLAKQKRLVEQKQKAIISEIRKFFNTLNKRRQTIIDDNGLNKLYGLMSNNDLNITSSICSDICKNKSIEIKINTYCSSNSSEINPIEERLSDVVTKDLTLIIRYLKVNDSLKNMSPQNKEAFERIHRLYNANETFKECVLNFLNEIKNTKNGSKKFNNVINLLNEKDI